MRPAKRSDLTISRSDSRTKGAANHSPGLDVRYRASGNWPDFRARRKGGRSTNEILFNVHDPAKVFPEAAVRGTRAAVTVSKAAFFPARPPLRGGSSRLFL